MTGKPPEDDWTNAELEAIADASIEFERATMPGYRRFLDLARRRHPDAPLDRAAMRRALAGMRPPDWLPYALENLGAFPTADAAWLLATAWGGSEFPSGAGVAEAVAAFRRVGFAADDGQERPTATLTVYRGADRPKAWHGLAWTIDEATAEWFARRFATRRPGYVFVAEVDPEGVLGVLADRGESTVLVDPDRLRDRRVLRKVEGRPFEDE